MKNEVVVIKRDPQGEEMIRWNAKVLEQCDTHVVLEARFSLSGHFMGEVPLYVGDRFVETYYSDRWYNSYEVHDRKGDQIKCWYCNVAYPAELSEDRVIFRDLALDLLVYPDGRQFVLDEDEFKALDLPPEVHQKALDALEELKRVYAQRLGQ